MTVASAANKVTLNGNGATTSWPFSFRIFDSSDLEIYKTDTSGVQTEITSNFSVVVNGESGGTVTYPSTGSPLASGETITIIRVTVRAQSVDFTSQGAFLPQNHEDADDRAMMILQELDEKIDRAFKLPTSDTSGTSTELTTDVTGSAGGVLYIQAGVLKLSEAANIDNLETLAGISGDITTVAANDANITTVANNLNGTDTIGTVAGSIANVNSVGGNISNVIAVDGNEANINAAVANAANINTVAGISADVTTVAGISSDVTAVAADAADIGVVSSNIADVNTVAGISANVTTVATDSAAINTVATDLAGDDDIGTVAASIANVDAVGSNISDITNAVSQAAAGVQRNTHTGDSSTVTFVLPATPWADAVVFAYLDGLMQDDSEWSVAGGNITFNTAPGTGVNIELVVLTAGTVTAAQTNASNAAVSAAEAAASAASAAAAANEIGLVDTIAELKALTGGVNEAVEVKGHTTSGDGGGGLFIWDGSDTTTDDNGIYIQPNAGGAGRWIRQYVGAVNLKWFGPAGDGVTDDTSVISASYLNKTLPIGEHLSSATVQTVADKGSLAGVTTAQSRIKRDALGGNLLVWSGVDYLDINNFTIDLQFSSNGDEGHGIVLIDTDYVNVENVDITDFGNNGGSAGSGIISYISGHTYNKAVRFNNLRIDGDTATSTDTNGALIVDGRYCMMTDLFVENIISFAIEYKEDTRYSLIGDSIAHNSEFGVGYGQSSVGDDGCDWNVAGNVVCHACDQGIIVGEGDYNLFSGFVIDSTGAGGTDIYGVHFSTDATGNAAFGVMTYGANMDYAVRYRADNCYAQIVSHDTSPNVVTLDSGATRNVTEIAHPGARNSIEGEIADSSGNDILGSTGNPVYCHATGEYIGSLSSAWKWKAGASGASFLSSHVWRYENDGAAVLAFGVPDGNVAGFTVNTDSGVNAGSMFFASSATPASEYWYMVVGGATSYRWYSSTFRPNTDNSIDLGASSVRWQDIFGYTGDFTTQVKVGGTKVVGAQGAAVADTTITYTANDPAIAPNDAVTIADGSAPTNSELLELCVELKNQIETLKGRLEAHGLIA
jgi:hypothetical protein